MKKRKFLIVMTITVICLALSGCKEENVEHLGLNAEIIEIDSENQMLSVKDLDDAGVFGDKCAIDCSEAIAQDKILYCNYETDEVKEISFSDLQLGDEIILNIDQTELEQIGKGEAIKANQIQLGTQRLE